MHPELRARAGVLLLVAGVAASCGGPRTSVVPSGDGIPGAGERGGATELPVERCGRHFLVEARLNGRGPFLLLLDTGFPRTQALGREIDGILGYHVFEDLLLKVRVR